jgi:hypothetical protein
MFYLIMISQIVRPNNLLTNTTKNRTITTDYNDGELHILFDAESKLSRRGLFKFGELFN